MKKKQLIVFYHLHRFHIFTSNFNFPGCSEIWAIGACSAGVLLMRAYVKSSWSFIWLAMFDLQLKWTGGGGLRAGEGRITPPHWPLSLFLTVDCPLGSPLYKFISLPSHSLSLKSKMAAIIFAKTTPRRLHMRPHAAQLAAPLFWCRLKPSLVLGAECGNTYLRNCSLPWKMSRLKAVTYHSIKKLGWLPCDRKDLLVPIYVSH